MPPSLLPRVGAGAGASAPIISPSTRKILTRLLLIPFGFALAVFACIGLPASTHYRVRETYVFRAGKQAAEIKLAVMVPKSGPYQEVRAITIAWEGVEVRESQGAVDVFKLTGRIRAGQEKVGTVSYDVVLRQGRARWQGPVEAFHLQPQPGIESADPLIVRAGAQIAAGQSREDAYRIHKFTAGYLRWHGESGTDPSLRLQSALKSYQTRSGVCGHFANLMTALCRVSGIPAQSITGLYMPPYPPLWSGTRTWGSPATTHAWVEFHTPAGWELADPSAASGLPIKWISFGRSDGSYLSYGERIAHRRIMDAMMAWAGERSSIIGGMSGPLRFAAAANADVSLSPRATVKAIWSGRWVYLAVLIGLGIGWQTWTWRRRAGIR